MLRIILLLILIYTCMPGLAQPPVSQDTFFLARKKGIIGKIGRSISTDATIVPPVKTVNPFIRYAGKRIRSIEVVTLGLDRNINDSTEVKRSFFVQLADAFHKNSRESFIRRNLFFKEGQVLVPFMFSDNERFLRDQDYLRDALIVVLPNIDNEEEVDVIVITRDVFSIGGTQRISSIDKIGGEIREENFNGTGARIALNGLYDNEREPNMGIGGELLLRNVKGKFVNWKIGFLNYNPAFNSTRDEETRYYTSIEKPLVSRYTEITGAIEADYSSSKNHYIADSLFDADYRYRNLRVDVWGGYNIGALRKRLEDSENRLRHFVALRTFYHHFYTQPLKFQNEYNYNYADINGVLVSYSLFKQNFYRTNFIYGFGRNEDIPVGINATVTGGLTNKNGKRRSYYGLSGEGTTYSEAGKYYGFTFRTGAFSYKGRFEDIEMLVGVDHFTALRYFGKYWRNRNFLNVGITRQFRNELSSPLFLESEFGLPYFRNGGIEGDFRSTIKGESVFMNMKKFLGFRFAPFVFADFTVIKPLDESWSKSEGYSAFGGGVRTRNENLVFGTIELKGFYFPRTSVPEMSNWRVEFSTKVRFKYNSTFIRRPDFVVAN